MPRSNRRDQTHLQANFALERNFLKTRCEFVKPIWAFSFILASQKVNINANTIFQKLLAIKRKQSEKHACDQKLVKAESLHEYLHRSARKSYKGKYSPFPFCYDISISLHHLRDVSTPWLESTCGHFNWLDMIQKGTHLSVFLLVSNQQINVNTNANTIFSKGISE